MKVKQGFIAAALVAVSLCVFCKLVVWLVQSDPELFGKSAFRVTQKLQSGIELGLIVAVTLVCLAFQGAQTTKESVADRRKEIPNPFEDDQNWMSQ